MLHRSEPAPSMPTNPILSIVTPTRGNFSPDWLERLLQVEGNVEFVLVYPPHAAVQAIDDPRIKSLLSPYKGEMMQRFVGLLNATGEFVIALDDDDFLHPQVLALVEAYFNHFPKSWILRLKKAVIDFRSTDRITRSWDALPRIEALAVDRKTSENPHPYQSGKFTGLLEVPIAPLNIPFDLRRVFLPFTKRKDNHGYHFENFNSIVWRNCLVQQALPDLASVTAFGGVLTWIPQSGFDRLLGLFVQAKFFQPNLIIGHWIPGAEQIRYIDKPARLKPPRFHVLSDLLLVKRFPQYGYLWNLFFAKLYGVPRTFAKLLKLKWKVGRSTSTDLPGSPEINSLN